MTTPPATYTAADGTLWEYFDFRVVHAPAGGIRHERTKLGSDHATHRRFRAPAQPDIGVVCYRFKAPWDYRDTDAQTLDRQRADAIALRAAGTVA